MSVGVYGLPLRIGLALRLMLTAAAVAVASSAAKPLHAMELQQALQAALAADPGLAAAQAQRLAASEAVEVAAGRMKPQLTLQTTQQILDQTTVGAAGVSLFSGRTRNTQLQGRLGVLRLRDRNVLELTRLQADQAELMLASAQADVFQRTAAAWVDVLGAQGVLEVFRRLARVADQIERQAVERLASGDGTKDVVAEAAAQRMVAHAQVQESEADLAAKLRVFELVTQVPPTLFGSLQLSPDQGLPDTVTGNQDLLNRVLEVNMDIVSARMDERIAEQRVQVVGAEHYPTIDLIAGHTQAESDTTNSLGQRYRNNAVGVQVVVPLFSGGSVSAAERQARASADATRAVTRAQMQRVESRFVAEVGMLEGLNRRVGGALALIDAAVEQRAAVNAAIEAGQKSLIDLSTAQQVLARRQADLLALQVQRGKLMARIFSLLPAQDSLVLRWAAAADRAVRQ